MTASFLNTSEDDLYRQAGTWAKGTDDGVSIYLEGVPVTGRYDAASDTLFVSVGEDEVVLRRNAYQTMLPGVWRFEAGGKTFSLRIRGDGTVQLYSLPDEQDAVTSTYEAVGPWLQIDSGDIAIAGVYDEGTDQILLNIQDTIVTLTRANGSE